jgi:hypothetical protein
LPSYNDSPNIRYDVILTSWILCMYQPLFPGESAVDQLVEIIKVLQNVPNRNSIPLPRRYLLVCDMPVGSWYSNP